MSARALTALLTTAGILALGVLGWWFWQMHATQTPPRLSAPKQAIVTSVPPVLPGDPYLGPRTSRATVIAFMDFGCTPCARGFSLMQELHSRLPQATFVWKDLPEKGDIVPVYMRAHIAARCAQNFNKFWDYAALLFGSQSAMGTFDFTGQAATLGIPKKPFEECMNSPATRRAVEEGAQMARDRGISSTPFFYIDGTRVDGLQPINTFHKLITDAL